MKDDVSGPIRPVRDLTKTSPHRTVGGFEFEDLTPYPAQYESYNEKHAILTLAFCHDVLSIRSQPVKSVFTKSNGKNSFHIPDFEVVTNSDQILIEVKAIENLLQTENIDKYREVAKHYISEGKTFHFLTNVQLEVKPRFHTISLLKRYLKSVPSANIISSVQQALSKGPMQIQSLMAVSGLELVDVYTLIANKYVTFDWSLPLNPKAEVSLPNQPFKGLTYAEIQRSTRFCDLLEELAMGSHPSNKFLVASAKNWRQANNVPGIWGVVGGNIEGQPLRSFEEVRFLRGAQYRRNYAPGLAGSSKPTEGEQS